jgi:hypothetical protein
MKTIIKIAIQILLNAFVTVGLLCLMAHLITVWKLDIVASSLFGILTGVIIVIIKHAIRIIFYER